MADHAEQNRARDEFTPLADEAGLGPVKKHKPNLQFMYEFPESLENFFRPFDDAIISFIQHLPSLYYINLMLTAITAIELSVALPFMFFVAGEDAIATEMTYLALVLSIASQIPKRFIWRRRPYMAGRAEKRRKDDTSSFPSRAVTCSVVYCFAGLYAFGLYYKEHLRLEWWMIPLMIVVPAMVSFARIQFGVHYPSDCLVGFFFGLLICAVATGAHHGGMSVCQSCIDKSCYAVKGGSAIEWSTPENINYLSLGITSIVFVIMFVLSVVPPLVFWEKAFYVYGFLLSCITFQVSFLCRALSLEGAALPAPSSPPWYALVAGITVSVVGTVLGLKLKTRRMDRGCVLFLFFYFVFLFTLITVRIR